LEALNSGQIIGRVETKGIKYIDNNTRKLVIVIEIEIEKANLEAYN